MKCTFLAAVCVTACLLFGVQTMWIRPKAEANSVTAKTAEATEPEFNDLGTPADWKKAYDKAGKEFADYRYAQDLRFLGFLTNTEGNQFSAPDLRLIHLQIKWCAVNGLTNSAHWLWATKVKIEGTNAWSGSVQ